jgi:organic hydroperoxide reductase OsmC/OhrA
MQKLPHQYVVTAVGGREGEVLLESRGIPSLQTAPPLEYGGPGDRWSPETLCVGAVADCFILTFRALARAAQLPWLTLQCRVVGTLDHAERRTRFTGFRIVATLEVPAEVDEAKARQLLERTEQSCLISNSLKGATQLEPFVSKLS